MKQTYRGLRQLQDCEETKVGMIALELAKLGGPVCQRMFFARLTALYWAAFVDRRAGLALARTTSKKTLSFTRAIRAPKVVPFCRIVHSCLIHQAARSHQFHGETITSIDEMSETRPANKIRAEITALRPIIGELVRRSDKPLLISENENGALEYHHSLAVPPTNSQNDDRPATDTKYLAPSP
jgi:hypothetical protein